MEESIVNPSFRAPEPINFTFYTKASWLKDSDTLAVTSVDGVVVFQAKSSLRDKQEFVDNTGKIVLSVKKQTGSSHKQWQVFRGNRSNRKDLLFTMKKSPKFDYEEAFDLFLQENTAEKKCDYKMKGSYDKKTCILYEGDSSTVAFKMSTRSSSEKNGVSQENAFKVAGQGSMDYQFIVAVVAVLHVHYSEEKKERNEKVMITENNLSGQGSTPKFTPKFHRILKHKDEENQSGSVKSKLDLVNGRRQRKLHRVIFALMLLSLVCAVLLSLVCAVGFNRFGHKE